MATLTANADHGLAELPAKPLIGDVGVIGMISDPWGSPWQPRQHVLTRLARYFNVVWFSPAHEWNEIGARLRSSLSGNKPFKQCGFQVYSPNLFLPRLHRPGWLAKCMLRAQLSQAEQLLRRQGCKKIVLYIWRPEFVQALDLARYDLSCYHIDDEYQFGQEDDPVSDPERRLLTESDQVIIHSKELLAKKGDLNPNTAFITNGVDYQLYAEPCPEPADLAAIPHPRVGYTGFLKRQLEWGLLERLAEDHPQWSFVFVGPRSPHPDIYGSLDRMNRKPNVHFLGPKKWQELGAYPQHFDTCIMPYDVKDGSAKYIFPLKLHEYLASGRPIVSTRIPALEDFGHVVALAEKYEDWCAEIEHSLAPSTNAREQIRKRQATAQPFDWSLIVDEIAGIFSQHLGSKYLDRFCAADRRNIAVPVHSKPGCHP